MEKCIVPQIQDYATFTADSSLGSTTSLRERHAKTFQISLINVAKAAKTTI